MIGRSASSVSTGCATRARCGKQRSANSSLIWHGRAGWLLPPRIKRSVPCFLTPSPPPAQSASRPSRLTRGYPRRSALYKEVLKEEIGWLGNVARAKKPARLPVVLTRDEVHKLFSHLQGTPRLMAGLLYGSGLRLMECVRLRVKDVDFGYAKIT